MKVFLNKLIGFSVGPVVGAFIAFITVPITTYFVNPTEFGRASMFILFQTLVVTFVYLGMDQSYTREYHNSKNKKNLFQNVLLLPLILSFCLLIITILFSNEISILFFGDASYPIISILFGIMIFFMVLERFILLSIRMEEKALEYSMLNILVKLVVLISTVIFVTLIRTDFLAVVYSVIIGQIVGDFYLLVRYRNLLNYKNFSLERGLIKKMLVFGLPLLIAASLTSLLNVFDRIAIRIWSDFAQLGVFTATLKIAAVLAIIQQSFTSFWVPTAYRWYEDGRDLKHFKAISDFTLLTMSTVMIAILLFKDLIVPILSADYSEAKFLIAFLCFQPILYTLSETTCLGIVFSRKSYLQLWVASFAIIANITLNVMLVPEYGAYGAAIATGVSYIFFFIGRSYFSYKNGMPIPVTKHLIVIVTLYIGAFINMFDIANIVLVNIALLILILLMQAGTFKLAFNIKRNPDRWDFT